MPKISASVSWLFAAALGLPAPADVQAAPAASIPARVFAGEPRGPYRTGTLQEFWIDESRAMPETADPDDKRRLTVQVWYPAEVRGDPAPAPYLLMPEQYLTGSGPSARTAQDRDGLEKQLDWIHAVRHVLTNSVREAKVAGTGERFPVLVYNHGGGHPQFTATFQTEFLASHGYIVVAISHPGWDGIRRRRFPDGYVYAGRRLTAPDDAPPANRSMREHFERMWAGEAGSLAAAVHEMVRDVSFALDRLASIDRDRRHRLHGRLDLERVGTLGWSIGGVTSLQASLADPRIKAAINQDGWPFGLTAPDGVAVRGSPRPVMVMNGTRPDSSGVEGEKDAAGEEAWKAAELHFWTLFQRSKEDWYWLRLAHGHHSSFSDLPLFNPDPGASRPDAIHPRLAHAIVNHYALEFFDRYLRERTDTPLLSGTQSYRDASLMRKAPPRRPASLSYRLLNGSAPPVASR